MGPGKPRERRELDGEDDEVRQIRASLGAGTSARNIVTSMVHPGVNPKKYKNLPVSGFFLFLLIIPISNGTGKTLDPT
jgi:hypothetical protein